MTSRTVAIDGTEFYINENRNYVGEVGTTRKWSPRHPRGFKLQCRDGLHWQHVGLTSFGDFGADTHQARELADRWCEKARRAWDALKADDLAC